MELKRLVAVVLGVLFIECVCYLLYDSRSQDDSQLLPKVLRPIPFEMLNHAKSNDLPWKKIPSFELMIRVTTNNPRLVQVYQKWFVRSMKLFWPRELPNVTLVLDGENKEDHRVGKELSAQWPYPRVAFRYPNADPSVYSHHQRRRMFWDYFYPENYILSEYVGFADTDTMFVTVVTPESLFEEGKPRVFARIGKTLDGINSCWPDATEFLLGEKELLQCMSYFPVIFKLQHLVDLRKYLEKRFNSSFDNVFYKAIRITYQHQIGGYDCLCQFSVMCNYVWKFHRSEYKFHLEMYPDDNWKGEQLRDSQASVDFVRNVSDKYKIPYPRISIHARHIIQDDKYTEGLDTLKQPGIGFLEHRLKEGICYSLASVSPNICFHACKVFNFTKLQRSLFSFEIAEWLWDSRCSDGQEEHYKNVKTLLDYYRRLGVDLIQTFNATLQGKC